MSAKKKKEYYSPDGRIRRTENDRGTFDHHVLHDNRWMTSREYIEAVSPLPHGLSPGTVRSRIMGKVPYAKLLMPVQSATARGRIAKKRFIERTGYVNRETPSSSSR